MDANPSNEKSFYNKELYSALEQAIISSKADNQTGAVIAVSIDNLPMIMANFETLFVENTMGELQEAIGEMLDDKDIIARTGRDRFEIVVHHKSKEQVRDLAKKIHITIQRFGTTLPSASLYFIPVMGSAIFPDDADTTEKVLDLAYVALYEAKQSDGDSYKTYADCVGRLHDVRNQMVMASYLREAIKDKKFRLAYQPVVNSNTGDIKYYEALLRIIGQEKNITSVGPFIPIAEKMGFISEIDVCVLELILTELKENADIMLSYNISNRTIESEEWSDRIISILKDSGVCDRLIVEIIETSAQHSLLKVTNFITTCQQLGCSVALDDFGTGYTSFTQIRKLPINIVKIDGSYIRDITDNVENQLFVNALLDISRECGLQSVAEFVEDEETANLLQEMGVDFLQGNYFAPALNYRSWLEGDES